jgi:hypothetical protein
VTRNTCSSACSYREQEVKITIILVAIVVGLFFYRQARTKRHISSQNARRQYDEIAASISRWAKDQGNHELFELARVALASYDEWYKRSTVLPIRVRGAKADEFAVLTEWRNLIQDSEWKAKNAWSGQSSDLLEMEYAINRAKLRERCGKLK